MSRRRKSWAFSSSSRRPRPALISNSCFVSWPWRCPEWKARSCPMRVRPSDVVINFNCCPQNGNFNIGIQNTLCCSNSEYALCQTRFLKTGHTHSSSYFSSLVLFLCHLRCRDRFIGRRAFEFATDRLGGRFASTATSQLRLLMFFTCRCFLFVVVVAVATEHRNPIQSALSLKVQGCFSSRELDPRRHDLINRKRFIETLETPRSE